MPFYRLRRGFLSEAFLRPAGRGSAFSQSWLLYCMERSPMPFYCFRRGPMDMVFLLPAPVAAWTGFCLLLSSNGK